MKYLIAFVLTSAVWANGKIPIPHLDLAMTGVEYYNLNKGRDDGEGNHELEPIIKVGNRLFNWLELINQNQVEGPYGCDKKFNMKPDYYIVPLDVFRKTQLTSPSDISSLSSDPKTNWNQQNFILI